MPKIAHGRVINDVIKKRIKEISINNEKLRTLESLSIELGKSRNYLSSAFNTDRIINLTILYKCAEVLNCDVPCLIPSMEDIKHYQSLISSKSK